MNVPATGYVCLFPNYRIHARSPQTPHFCSPLRLGSPHIHLFTSFFWITSRPVVVNITLLR